MLRSFINRKTELEALNKAYRSSRAEFFIIYGRRRIGKTELIKEFAKDKLHFYHLARRQSLTLEKEELSRRFAERFNIYLPAVNSFEATFKNILEKIPKTEKLIIIIDEFPYWVAEDENILSEFQHLWDEFLQNSSIFLILCGSYLSLMEEKVLGVKSPLYGRRTGQLKIEPLPVNTLKYFVPKYNLEEIVKVYGSLGGVPFYLKEVDDGLSFFENVRNTFLNKSNILNKEAEFLLREELREVNVYFNILRAITEGATTISEIAAKSRVEVSNIHKYLAILQGLALIKKIKPLNAPVKEKRYLYQIEDNYFRFWLRYI
ncbi:ATP-binding protein, partial [Candidatus Woesearchaeota archaeon]|nr:ATP-binding protein [Candidatus Woesearchaeota archaeon]